MTAAALAAVLAATATATAAGAGGHPAVNHAEATRAARAEVDFFKTAHAQAGYRTLLQTGPDCGPIGAGMWSCPFRVDLADAAGLRHCEGSVRVNMIGHAWIVNGACMRYRARAIAAQVTPVRAARLATRRARRFEREIAAGPYRASGRRLSCAWREGAAECDFTVNLRLAAAPSTVVRCTGTITVSTRGLAELGPWGCVA